MRYAQIRSLDISNGENIGVALFTQGCPIHCYNCFNKEAWDFNGGKEWTEGVKDQFLKLIDRPYIKRVSILGGEPLAEENLSDIALLVDEITTNFPEKTIWLYTGYRVKLFDENIIDTDTNKVCHWFTVEDFDNDKEFRSNYIRQFILNHIDVIVDGPYVDAERDVTLKWRGSKNQRVIDVKKSRKQGEIVLYCD